MRSGAFLVCKWQGAARRQEPALLYTSLQVVRHSNSPKIPSVSWHNPNMVSLKPVAQKGEVTTL